MYTAAVLRSNGFYFFATSYKISNDPAFAKVLPSELSIVKDIYTLLLSLRIQLLRFEVQFFHLNSILTSVSPISSCVFIPRAKIRFEFANWSTVTVKCYCLQTLRIVKWKVERTDKSPRFDAGAETRFMANAGNISVLTLTSAWLKWMYFRNNPIPKPMS